MIFIHAFIPLITYQSYAFKVFLTALMLKHILKQRENKENQKNEFMGCTMTSHGFKLNMYGFYTSQSFKRVQDHPIQSSNEKYMAS